MNGWTITGATASRSGGTGTLTIQLHNITDGVDVFSTKLTVDSGETSSLTAAAPVVINTSNDDLATGDRFRIDVDVSGTNSYNVTVNVEASRP